MERIRSIGISATYSSIVMFADDSGIVEDALLSVATVMCTADEK